jgi:hypothetical protein
VGNSSSPCSRIRLVAIPRIRIKLARMVARLFTLASLLAMDGGLSRYNQRAFYRMVRLPVRFDIRR